MHVSKNTSSREAAIIATKVKKQLPRVSDTEAPRKVRIPSNLSKKYLKSNTPEWCSEDEWVNACWYIAGTIVRREEGDRKKGKTKNGVPLYTPILKQALGKHYDKFIRHMCSPTVGLIHKTQDYYVGTSSRHYKLGSAYIGTGYKWRTIYFQPLLKRLDRYAEIHQEQQNDRSFEYYYLVRWLQNNQLTIDQKAFSFLLKHYRERKAYWINTAGWDADKTAQEFAKLKTEIAIVQKQMSEWPSERWTIDDQGRLYSITTKMKSIFRNLLTFNGESLVSIDLKYSQPMHIMFCLRKEFFSKANELSLEKLYPELAEQLKEHYKDITTIYNTLMIFQKNPQTVTSKGFQLQDFSDVVRAGYLYEYLIEYFKTHHKRSKKLHTRAGTKKWMLIMLYNQIQRIGKGTKHRQILQTLFPDIEHLITSMKLGRYQDMSKLLQRIEALMLLGKVCKSVFMFNKDIPLFTVHDSIITTKQHASTVKRILIGEYRKILGFDVHLHETDLTIDHYHKEVDEYICGKLKINPDSPKSVAA